MVKQPKQPPLFGQRPHAAKKSLQACPRRLALDCDQTFFVVLPSPMPPCCDERCVLGRIHHLETGKSGFEQQPFIFPRWTEQVVTNRAAGSNFFVRNNASDDQGVTE